MSIPKKIHYCWFGKKPLTPLAKKCIASWEKYLPDYEIILWNEDNFDVNINQYVKEAYISKKYAFVTDYVRLYALYNYGGIYMDTDVEVLKPLDQFLEHRAFTGCESNNMCVTGIIASEQHHPWIGFLLKYYKDKNFILPNGKLDTTPNTAVITRLTMEKYGWIPKNELQILDDGIYIYPFEVFCAKDFRTNIVNITDETYTIHHFSGSWVSKTSKIKSRIKRFLGPKLTKFIIKCKNKLIKKEN